MKATHLVSDIPGLPGRRELLGFGRQIGLRPEWLQRVGSEFEHFDLFGKMIERALGFGAKRIDRRGLMDIVFAKREARTGSKRRRAYAYARAVQRRKLREAHAIHAQGN